MTVWQVPGKLAVFFSHRLFSFETNFFNYKQPLTTYVSAISYQSLTKHSYLVYKVVGGKKKRFLGGIFVATHASNQRLGCSLMTSVFQTPIPIKFRLNTLSIHKPRSPSLAKLFQFETSQVPLKCQTACLIVRQDVTSEP